MEIDFGVETTQEMCSHFLLYWPAQKLGMVTVPDSSSQLRNLRLGTSFSRNVVSTSLNWNAKQKLFRYRNKSKHKRQGK